MKEFLKQYGFAILTAIVIIILISMLTPVGNLIKLQIFNITDEFAGKADIQMSSSDKDVISVELTQKDNEGTFDVAATSDSSTDVFTVSYRVKDQNGNWNNWKELGTLATGSKKHSGTFKFKISNNNRCQVRVADKNNDLNSYIESDIVVYTGSDNTTEQAVSSSPSIKHSISVTAMGDVVANSSNPTECAEDGSVTLSFEFDISESYSISSSTYAGTSDFSSNLGDAGTGIFTSGGTTISRTISGSTLTLTVTNLKYDLVISLENGCFIKGTKITMGDGSLKNIEDIKIGDEILSVDHETGKFEAQSVYFVSASENEAGYFTLNFADGNDISIVASHSLFEQESMKYVSITEANCMEHIGKHFYNATTKEFTELVSVELDAGYEKYYSVYSSQNYNCIANNMLSVPTDTDFFLNIYEMDSSLKADTDKLNEDLKKYGLFVLETDDADVLNLYNLNRWKYLNIIEAKENISVSSLKEAAVRENMLK